MQFAQVRLVINNGLNCTDRNVEERGGGGGGGGGGIPNTDSIHDVLQNNTKWVEVLGPPPSPKENSFR